MNTFVRNYEGKFRGLKGTFVSQEEAAKFGARQQDVMRRLQGRATELLLKGQIQESRQALDAKLKLAEERKDWKGYEDAVMGGLNAGLLAPDQAELMKEKANKINLGQQFDNLAATNPGGAYDLLDSEAYKNQFSQYELDVMRRRLASQARPAIADSFFNSFVLTRKKDKGKSGTKNDGPEWTGFFTKRNVSGYVPLKPEKELWCVRKLPLQPPRKQGHLIPPSLKRKARLPGMPIFRSIPDLDWRRSGWGDNGLPLMTCARS